MQPEGSSSISELALICDNLLSNKAQRHQELQSISDLLDGIKQLQAAQQASAAAVWHPLVTHMTSDTWAGRLLPTVARIVVQFCVAITTLHAASASLSSSVLTITTVHCRTG
jgi:hypothetical protein